MDEPPPPSATSELVDHLDSRVTRAAEGLPRRRFTVVEVEAMVDAGVVQDDERVELIGGELVPLSPKGNRHELVKVALLRRWYRATPDDIEIAPETTFRLSADTCLEPDIVLFDRAAGLSTLSGESVYLVIEISDSSLRYDIGRKAALYASFGDRELWVIDAVHGTIRTFRAPRESGYTEVLDLDAAGIATPLFAPGVFALRLSDLGIF